MLKTNLNGVLGTEFGFGKFVFIGIEATSAPDFFFELYGMTTSSLATWSAEATATPASPVPEPQTYAMILGGIGVIALMLGRQNSRRRERYATADVR